jgi:hypothetical protein
MVYHKNTLLLTLLGLVLILVGVLGLSVHAQQGEGSFTVTVGVRGTVVEFSGKTMPNSLVTFTEQNTIIGTTVSNNLGQFSYSYPYAVNGPHQYGVQAEDSSQRLTEKVIYYVSIDDNETLEIANIFLPPTIELLSQNLMPGETATVIGQAQPGATITLAVDPTDIVRQTTTNLDGNWSVTFPVSFQSGGYNVFAIASTLQGMMSEPSDNQLLIVIGDFTPTPIPSNTPIPTPTPQPGSTPTPTPTLAPGQCCSKRSDLNCDGKVSLPDFSILMFYWQKSNECADANKDGIISLPDFSIMMFDWGK